MRRLASALIGLLVAASMVGASWAGEAQPSLPTIAAPDSRSMQNELQQLPWPQFRSVIEAVPKLKAEVDAFGTAGWQLVKDNYRLYPWRKSIDKLDPDQKRQLAELIGKAKGAPR